MFQLSGFYFNSRLYFKTLGHAPVRSAEVSFLMYFWASHDMIVWVKRWKKINPEGNSAEAWKP